MGVEFTAQPVAGGADGVHRHAQHISHLFSGDAQLQEGQQPNFGRGQIGKPALEGRGKIGVYVLEKALELLPVDFGQDDPVQ